MSCSIVLSCSSEVSRAHDGLDGICELSTDASDCVREGNFIVVPGRSSSSALEVLVATSSTFVLKRPSPFGGIKEESSMSFRARTKDHTGTACGTFTYWTTMTGTLPKITSKPGFRLLCHTPREFLYPVPCRATAPSRSRNITALGETSPGGSFRSF